MRVAWLEDRDLNYAMLAFEDEDSGDFFAVQRSFTFDDQDRELGMDTYCLVRGDATHYGGLESFEVADTQVRLQLDSAAADVLELPLLTEIAIDPDQAETVRARLPGLTTLKPAE